MPVLFPAVDSHATYFGPYSGSAPWSDEVTEEEGEHVRPNVVPVSDADGWIAWPGSWGGSTPTFSGEFESASPHGPAYLSEHGQWADPTGFAESAEDHGGGCESSSERSSARREQHGASSMGAGTTLSMSSEVVNSKVAIDFEVNYESGATPVEARTFAERPGRGHLPVGSVTQLTGEANQTGEVILPVLPGSGLLKTRVVLYGPEGEELATAEGSVSTGKVTPASLLTKPELERLEDGN